MADKKTIIGAGGGGCFAKGTTVATPNGKVAIELLKAGDQVIAFDDAGNLSTQTVEETHVHDNEPIWRYRFWNGVEVNATPNHWVLNQYGNFAEIGTLTNQDAIIDGDGHIRPLIGAEFIENGTVYNLTVSNVHTYIANHIRVHNTGRGAGNLQRAVQGAGGGGGKGGGGSGGRVPVESPNTLESRSFATVLDALAEGEIVGLVNGAQSIYLDSTPLQNPDGSYNFTGVSWDFRAGTQSQSYIPLTEETGTEVNVGVEVKAGLPIARALTDSQAEAVRVTITVPSLTFQNPSNGDMSGTSVQIAIDVQGANSGWQQRIVDTIEGKTVSLYQRDYIVGLGGLVAPYQVRVRRITPDATSANVQNKTFFASLTEIIYEKLRYPNTALVALRLDSKQFSRIPTRAYDVRLLKVRVPVNYDPYARTYSGVWNGQFKVAWTDNPAWCFFDLLTNERYGLGAFVNTNVIDKWALYKIARYCDELVPNGFGGVEPRFTCNVYMQTRREAYQVVRDFATIFRGMVYWASGSIVAVQDAPADADYLYTNANVIDGSFTYNGSSLKTRPTVALVTWNDPADMYRQKVEYVADEEGIARNGVLESELIAVGCTSRGQAHRVGKWLLYSSQYETETVTFSTGFEGNTAYPSQIIKVADESRAGRRIGGRVVAATTTTLTTDAPLPQGANEVSVVMPNGDVQTKTIASRVGNVVTVTSAFTQAPQVGSIWVSNATSVQEQLFRVVSMKEDAETGTVAITALAYNPTKYNAIELGWQLQERDITALSRTPDAVTNIIVDETLYAERNVTKTMITLSWTAPEFATQYEVQYKRENGNYQTLPLTSVPSIEIRNQDEGVYSFRVTPIGATGLRGAVTEITKTILGKTAPPANVTGLGVERRQSDLLIYWDKNTEPDILGYEVRVGTSWDSGTLVGITYADQITHDQSEAGLYYYFVKAFDTSNKFSPAPATYALELLAPQTVQQFDVVQAGSRLEFRWRANPESQIAGYEIREGTAWETSTLITVAQTTWFTMPCGNAGSRRFLIKAIASPGIYSQQAAFTVTDIAKPQQLNVIYEQKEEETGWNGIKHFFNVVEIDGEDNLVMGNGVARAEYLTDVELGDITRAQNSVLSEFRAIVNDTEAWLAAQYDWDSTNANRQWIRDGSLQSINARFQISRYDGALRNETEGEIIGIRLDNSLTPLSNVASLAESDNIVYGQGRYGHGVYVNDVTRLAYTVQIPSVFSTYFWFIPTQVTDSQIWRASGVNGALSVGYDTRTQSFYLTDHLGNEVRVPFAIVNEDRVCIAINQLQAKRELFVGKMDGVRASANATYSPVGSFNSLRLN